MLECEIPQWVSIVIDWFNNGIISGDTMCGILEYFYNKGFCVEVELV